MELYPGREDQRSARRSRTASTTTSTSRDGVELSEADFPAIEERMRAHVKAAEPFVREDVPVARRPRALRGRGPGLQGRADRRPRRATSGVETVSLYTNGPFTDLCRGPHAPSTATVKAFALQSVAGAYWRGDSTRPMLTRIYGTAFFSKEDLDDAPRAARAGARARPPPPRPRARPLPLLRALARAAAFWTPHGTTLWNTLRELWRSEMTARARLHARSRRRSSTTPSCGRRPATGTSTATTCSSPTTTSARWASSR